MDAVDLDNAIQRHLGWAGRMISGSKSGYHSRYPTHDVFFNSCLFNADFEQVWWGDIDLTLDSGKVQALADETRAEWYLTREQPYRWDGLSKKDLDDDRVRIFKPV